MRRSVLLLIGRRQELVHAVSPWHREDPGSARCAHTGPAHRALGVKRVWTRCGLAAVAPARPEPQRFFFYPRCERSQFKRVFSRWMLAAISRCGGSGDTTMADSDGTLVQGPLLLSWTRRRLSCRDSLALFLHIGRKWDASANFIYVTDNHPNKAGHVIPSTWTDDFFIASEQ